MRVNAESKEAMREEHFLRHQVKTKMFDLEIVVLQKISKRKKARYDELH